MNIQAYNFIFFNHWFHFSLIFILVLLLIFTDLFYRKILSRKNRPWNDRMFREIAERSFDTIFLMDMGGVLTYVSPSAEKLFLRKDTDAVGKNINAFIKEPGREKVAELFAELFKKGHLEGLELTVLRGDGSTVDIEVNVAAVIKGGRPKGAQGVMRDITERKKFEKTLKERNEELEKINRLMVGREMKIIELKEEIEKLKKEGAK